MKTSLLEAADRTAATIFEARKQSQEAWEAMERFRKALDALDPMLVQIAEFGSDTDPKFTSLRNRIRRIHELRNQMEVGSFKIEVNRVLEIAWQRLP